MFRVQSPPQPSTGSDSFIHPQLLRVYKVNILGFDGLTRFGVFWDTESGLGFRDSLGLRNFVVRTPTELRSAFTSRFLCKKDPVQHMIEVVGVQALNPPAPNRLLSPTKDVENKSRTHINRCDTQIKPCRTR